MISRIKTLFKSYRNKFSTFIKKCRKKCGKEYYVQNKQNMYFAGIFIGYTVCIILAILAFYIRSYTVIYDALKALKDYEIVEMWFSIAKAIQDFFNPTYATLASLGSIAVSATILFLKRENKHFYMQIHTFFRSNKLKLVIFSILFILSILFAKYLKMQDRPTSGTFSIFSFIVITVGIAYYLIRYNNESQYFRDDSCYVIIKSSNKPKKQNRYLEIILPEHSEEHNIIDNDIDILKLLVQKVSFEKDFGFKNLAIVKKIFKNNELLVERRNQEKVIKYFRQVLIPYTTQLMKTYRNNRLDLIITLCKELSCDFHKNLFFNKMMRYFILVICRQYLIENDNNNNNEFAEKSQFINDWLFHAQNEFFQIYEVLDYSVLFNYEKSQEYFWIYSEYIEQLYTRKLLNVNAYAIKELDYMKKHKNLRKKGVYVKGRSYGYAYIPIEVVFLDIIE